MDRSTAYQPTAVRPPRTIGAAAIVAALALVSLPATAVGQGADQYDPAAPENQAPSAPGQSSAAGSQGDAGAFASASTPGAVESDDSVGAAGATGGDDSATGSGAATDTVTETSGTGEQLPVTGLPAIPLAITGLVMMVLGALGLRRFSGPPRPQDHDPSDPSGTRRILGR